MSIKIEVGGWTECSGTQVTLYVDPENRRVYTFSNVGNGEPMTAFHGRRMGVGQVPTDTVPASLQGWVESQEGLFSALMDEYQGHEFNGTDHKGRWSERGVELAQSLDEALQDALRNEAIQSYWDAEEWFSNDPGSVIDAAIAVGSIEEAVENEIENAKMNGAVLDRDDVEQALRTLLRGEVSPRHASDGDVPKIRALLGAT